MLQPSSPFRHACELKEILKLRGGNIVVVIVFFLDGLEKILILDIAKAIIFSFRYTSNTVDIYRWWP